mmetsp:Transcript_1516/g.5208  ORF Transcript_1516/g.5208 Transcript_1516/m.5208 type:complete len:237 (+) Transcript_1516:491-1201(+)
MSFAKTFSRGTSSASATGLIIGRNPPLTRYTVLFAALSASNKSLIPGDSFGGFSFTNASTLRCVGCITISRLSSASRKLVVPPIAALVIAATSSPFPRNPASSSMPSSTHTVESTSKQNADAAAIKDRTSLEGSLLFVAGMDGAATLITTLARFGAVDTRACLAFKSRGATRGHKRDVWASANMCVASAERVLAVRGRRHDAFARLVVHHEGFFRREFHRELREPRVSLRGRLHGH